MSPAQVKAAAERRVAEAQAGARSGPLPRAPVVTVGEKERQNSYTSIQKDGTIHEYIGPAGGITFDRPHVHVIHDEKHDEVRLHLTDASGGHTHEIALVGATGSEVNAAVDVLTDVLRARGR
jgi:hypothetical protein